MCCWEDFVIATAVQATETASGANRTASSRNKTTYETRSQPLDPSWPYVLYVTVAICVGGRPSKLTRLKTLAIRTITKKVG